MTSSNGGNIAIAAMFGVTAGLGLATFFTRRKHLRASPGRPQYTLYSGERCPFSFKVIVFLAEAKLLDQIKIVHPTKAQLEEIHAQTGKAAVPCLKEGNKYMIESDAIIDYLANKNGLNRLKMNVLTMFMKGVYKDYMEMHSQISSLSKKAGGNVTDGCAWFKALDQDGDGNVSLDELLDGLNITYLLNTARKDGNAALLGDHKWVYVVDQIALLLKDNPDFVEGHRLKLILGTISDNYEMLFEAADTIIRLKPGDHQALLLKALYCRSLGKDDEFNNTMNILKNTSDTMTRATKNLIEQVDSVWDAPIKSTVENGIKEKMSILALGSPANDDGTPRPRLLGTLRKTLEIAQQYPEADIYVTGAAVSTSMPEAIAMRNWLTERGIEKDRIIMEMKALDTVGNYVNILPMLEERGVQKVVLVTVLYHLQRSSVLAEAIFSDNNEKGGSIEVIRCAGESDMEGEVLEKRMKVERAASYRDLARALKLYEASDYKKRCGAFASRVRKVINMRRLTKK